MTDDGLPLDDLDDLLARARAERLAACEQTTRPEGNAARAAAAVGPEPDARDQADDDQDEAHDTAEADARLGVLDCDDYQTALAWLTANANEDLEGLRLLARTIREPERLLQAVTEIALIAANTAAKDHFDGDVRAYLTWLAPRLDQATQQEDKKD
ncbi:MAG: hypothetical protein LBS56_10335 [Propionibacteriaceae bacterium]|jgi:hypothetical protein|nr:hypothetical protein [Propionibacteriaceae bacterium]